MATIMPYTTKAGKRYRVRYRKPDNSQTDKRGFKTKREAEDFLASIAVSKSRGEYVDPSASRITIGELGASWIKRQTHMKPSSIAPVESAWRVHVEPRWGTTPIARVKPTDVQAWVSELTSGTSSRKPKSATTVKRCHGVLAGILDDAVKDRRLTTNVARGVNMPRKVSKPHVYLSHKQVALLSEQCRTDEKATLVLALAYTGLRFGELIGLRVRSLDMLRRRMFVHENAVWVNNVIEVGTPKGHEYRSVPFPEFLTLRLARLCEGKSPDSLVFGDGEVHVKPPAFRGGWYIVAIRKAQKLDPTIQRITIHDLRHTAASLAISAGANVKAVQRMLGHASAAMTLDTYADLFDDDLDAVAVALNDARAISNVGKMWAEATSDDAARA